MPRTLPDKTRTAALRLASFATCILLIQFALISIHEISVRADFLARIDREIAELERQQPGPRVANLGAGESTTGSPSYSVESLADLSSRLETLSAIGSTSDEITLASVRTLYNNLAHRTQQDEDEVAPVSWTV